MFGFNTKPLNDNTSGFRFNTRNFSGIYRKRKTKAAYRVVQGATFTKIELGKRVVYLEHNAPLRQLWNW